MSSRDWRANREVVFERDEYTCRHCDSAGGPRDAAAVRVAAVGDVPLQGTVHESALVTVCDECFHTLHADEPIEVDSRRVLFEAVRDVTRLQGATISAVANFASLSTTVPAALESGDDLDYVSARQDALVALAVVDARLEHLERYSASGDAGDLRPEIESPLAAFCQSALNLQAQLRAVVELAETVSAGLERCRGCFAPTDADADSETCPTCRVDRLETGEWERDDGSVRFDDLFTTINTSLRESSGTTEELTGKTQTLAASLVDR